MKKFVAGMIAFLVLLCSICLAESTPEETAAVVNMPYTLALATGEREGLYTGGVKDGLPEGFGVFVTHNSEGVEWHYIGNWENGQFSGEGAQYWENGMVMKGEYAKNEKQNPYVRWYDSLMTKWFDDYDADGNRHFITYYPGSFEQKYCEGFADMSQKEVVSVTWFDLDGNEIDSAETLTLVTTAYPD